MSLKKKLTLITSIGNFFLKNASNDNILRKYYMSKLKIYE